jgi:hypothetical protein
MTFLLTIIAKEDVNVGEERSLIISGAHNKNTFSSSSKILLALPDPCLDPLGTV